MRIFVYEFVTGGGAFQLDASPNAVDPLVAEGSAMVRSLVADLAELRGVSVDVLRDRRFDQLDLRPATVHDVASASEEQAAIRELARRADWSIVIAPEFCGYLVARCRTIEQVGGRLLGPGTALVALASDKHATAEHLAAHGINVPRGTALAANERLPEDFSYPAVLKPHDGAGSQGVRLIATPPADCDVGWHWRLASAEQSEALHWRDASAIHGLWRLETFCPGTAASVACLCGPDAIVPLVPCMQLQSADGRFTYLGGSLPIDPALAARAASLAARAVATLNGAIGYLGVDLVLGADPLGGDDVVLEINPRLTTSYVGLRALSERNLAAALLAIASGERFELAWRKGRVRFEANGTVWPDECGSSK